MGAMKDLLITVHNGGDEAVAAVERIGKDWREQLEQAADEIARLRLAICRLADQDATLSVQGGHILVTMDGTLTQKEREALKDCVYAYALDDDDEECASIANTLRGLLERLA